MIIYPAIDVLDGRVVRLAKGDFDAVTEYGDDPVAAARSWIEAGASWLHLVDLSGARDGARRQHDLVEKIAGLGINVQTGGGVRSRDDVRDMLNAGAMRVVIGSLAVSQSGQVRQWLEDFGSESIAAAFDIQLIDNVPYPTLRGWRERSSRTLAELLNDYIGSGLRHALATDVDRDGMMSGPNVEFYEYLLALRSEIEWQASGGVSSLNDVQALKAVGVSGAITGRALFEGAFSLQDALAC
jgi:phosphoribosylformimino-5-aminoimidazole carboxamide ribotide isomerase